MRSAWTHRSVTIRLFHGGIVAALAAMALLMTSSAAVQGAAGQGPRVGIICTSDAGTHPVFNLTTKTGYIKLPDANTAFMWGYSSGDGAFQHPSPVLCVNEGDTVTVILHNTLSEPVSVVFPGQEDVLADGAPSEPVLAGGQLTSLTKTADANGGSVTYSFVAGRPGTFIYESGTNPEKQVRMGLFGALIVRPARGANYVYDREDSKFGPAEEFMVLLSEIDPYQHQAVEQGKSFDIRKYHPRYWLLNGRGFPDTIADNFASWLPNQPYGALAEIFPYDPADHPDYSLARYLNVGTEDFPHHPHGNNGTVIGRDGHPLARSSDGADLSFEKFDINIGPGQTWDVLFRWYDPENYSVDNPVPVTVPSLANQEIGVFYSGSPYLGETQPLPPGVQTVNQCGEYYIISHNHALFQITSWGATMTGPITYMRIDPPEPNSCSS